MTANRAASIRARLKQHTDTSKQDFNLTLTRYGLERLLYRLSVSEHAPNFLLKGALLFHLWYGQPHRPTRDADLLGFGPDDVPTLVGVFRSIASIAVDDGIVFDPTSVVGSPIRKDAGYGGVRIDLRATLDGARLSLQIDIGFGDAVTPAAQSVAYPTLLPDVPTVGETLPGYEMSVWYAAFGPAGMPRDLVTKLNAEINKAMAVPEVRARMEAMGVEVVNSTPEQLGETLRRDTVRYTKVIQDLNIKLD